MLKITRIFFKNLKSLLNIFIGTNSGLINFGKSLKNLFKLDKITNYYKLLFFNSFLL